MVRKRKSPIRHRVKSHTRRGFRVNSYGRGHGNPTRPFAQRKVLGSGEIYCPVEKKIKTEHCERCSSKEEGFSKSHEPRSYTVEFTYADGENEVVKAVSHSPAEAYSYADTHRKRKTERPTQVVVKNRIGEILGKFVRGAGKVAGKVAGVAVGAGKEALEAYREEKERTKVREEAYIEELKERARKGDITARRILRRKGIIW